MLLRHLLNFFFPFLMLFAAGPTALGGDGGTTSEPAAGATDADTSTTDTTADTVDASADDSTATTDDTAQSADSDGLVDLGDGRRVPEKIKNLFELAKQNGLDKEIRQIYFSNQRLLQKFPGGVNEAFKLADQMAEFGGVEGISDLKSQNEIFAQDAELFTKDQKKWIETSFEEDSEASLKAFQYSLDYVAEKYSDEYNHLMAKVVFNTLSDSESLHNIYNLLQGQKDSPEAQKAAKDLAQWYNGIKATADKIPEKKIDPKAKELDTREAKIKEQEEQAKHSAVNNVAFPHLKQAVTTQLQKIALQNKADLKKIETESPAMYREMLNDIQKRIMQKASQDKAFVRNYSDFLGQGNIRRAASEMNKKHDSLMPDVVKEVAAEWGLIKPAVTTRKPGAPVAAGSSNAGINRVSAKPDSKLIDWGKTGDKIYDSVAVMKDGKTVTWA